METVLKSKYNIDIFLTKKRVDVKRVIRKLGGTIYPESPIFFDLKKLKKHRKKLAQKRFARLKPSLI